MATPGAPSDAASCPFLMPVMADRLWLYPVGAYCRLPAHWVRVPAGTIITCICMTVAHLVCPGYLAGRRPHPSGRMPR